MIRKWLVIGIILLFVGVTIAPTIAQNTEKQSSRGNWLYVGGSGPGNYSKIQDAIDNASDGNTIFVYNGFYYGNLEIYKSIILLGENKITTVIDGEREWHNIINISSSNVTIQEFTFCDTGNQSWGVAVIEVGEFGHIKNIKISNCVFENNDKCIQFCDVSNLLVEHCQFFNNDYNGVQSQNGYHPLGQYSENINITDCTMHNNGREGYSGSGGICILNLAEIPCSNVDISNCDIYDNIGDGIQTHHGVPNVTIHHNKIHGNNDIGVNCLANEQSNFVDIHNNLIYNNKIFGIRICSRDNFSNIIISGNTILSNGNGTEKNFSYPREGGIYVQEVLVTGMIIKNNTIAYNDMCGIILEGTTGVKVLQNNLLDNVDSDASFTYAYWDKIFPLNQWEGNYWSRTRLLPKPIFGLFYFYNFDMLCFMFDWHPAQEPYDIPGMS